MDDLLIIDLRNPKMNAAQTMADAADEIEKLRTENTQLATLLLSQKVFVHETITTQVDELLKPYIGGHQ